LVKTFYISIFFLLAGLGLFAQPDSAYTEGFEADTTPPLPPVSFHLQEIGVDWVDGNVQFFEGYDAQILYANAQSGLPIYPDWGLYSRNALLPRYYQFGIHAAVVDSVRGLKLRFTGAYSHREDSMNYASDFHVNDTIYGRIASEKGSFGSVSLAALKQSRKLLGFLRFYGGAELELGLSPRSKILFQEYAADTGEDRLVEYNEFQAIGKPRFNVFGTAILGLETVFFKRVGFLFEIKSGLGWQLVIEEKAFGMGRTTYHAGLNYYLFDFNRKALPRPVMVPKEEGEPEQPPTPGF
jgi:hypothetical protein